MANLRSWKKLKHENNYFYITLSLQINYHIQKEVGQYRIFITQRNQVCIVV